MPRTRPAVAGPGAEASGKIFSVVGDILPLYTYFYFMNRLYTSGMGFSVALFVLVLLTGSADAQFITGKWYGVSDITSAPGYHESSKEPSGEILQISGVDSNKIEGLSYHYYWFRGGFYYSIKTLECTYDAKKDEWIIKETAIKDKHLYFAHYDCLHTYLLKFSTHNQKDSLTGTWSAASFDDCGAGTGRFTRTKPVITAEGGRDSVEAMLRIVPLKENTSMVRQDLTQAVSKEQLKKEVAYQQMMSRTRTLIKAIPLQTPDIRVEIWDAGVIDGDNISVYFNKELIINRKRIAADPLVINLKAVPGQENELIMYANNLGDIPPNTAMMRVYANGKTYEVEMSSDEKSNGIIRFTY